MATYPEIHVIAGKSKARGGASGYTKIVVDASTTMPCGDKFKVRKRGSESERETFKTQARMAVEAQATMHLKRCKKGCNE